MFEDLLAGLDDSYTIDQLEKMISIRSVVGEEAELAEYLKGEMEALGLETELDEAEPGRPGFPASTSGRSGEAPTSRTNMCPWTACRRSRRCTPSSPPDSSAPDSLISQKRVF